jgi:hypothetical protein
MPCPKRSRAIVVALFFFSAPVFADQAACDAIRAANQKTGSKGVSMKSTGYAFASDTPELYGSGTQTCEQTSEETIDGQAALVYREQYKSTIGTSDAKIWISKSTGLVMREEQDGEITGKGKGHITYQWPTAKP